MLRRYVVAVLSLLVAVAAIAYALLEQSWVPAYWEAEPLHRVALQFGRGLTERLASEHREEVQWTDVTTLLAEDRFASLKDKGFLPSAEPDILITIRLNDRFDAPIRKDGFVLLRRR